MIPTSAIFNFGVFITLIISPQVCTVMINYEEPFPPRLPIQVKSKVSFTQYANIPMLSLDEIKKGFPWLDVATENVANREDTVKPRYVFYYVPRKLSLRSGLSINSETRLEKQNSLRNKNNNLRSQLEKSNDQTRIKTKPTILNDKKIIYKTGALNARREDQKSEESKSKIERSGDKLSVINAENHRLKDRDNPDRKRAFKITNTRQMPSYLYPKVPSPYMELPKTEFEEKEYWVNNKQKLKRPIGEDSELKESNEKRLKNHRVIDKQKKSKTNNLRDEKRVKNHKPIYDREHDPQEYSESSSQKVEKLHKRPKENPKNPLLLSQDGERIEFHIQGHEGPQSYIFGYDTGSGENRHFRLEERLRDGSVKGHYGYYDSNGKLKMVEYKASPMKGYEEKHHESPAYLSDET